MNRISGTGHIPCDCFKQDRKVVALQEVDDRQAVTGEDEDAFGY